MLKKPHVDQPQSWKKYRKGDCEGCWAACCTMPVEMRADDAVRLELCHVDEIEDNPRKVARKLLKTGIIASYREKTGIYTLARTASGDCIYLTLNRTCEVYDKRPKTCREFPNVSSRPGFCPCFKK